MKVQPLLILVVTLSSTACGKPAQLGVHTPGASPIVRSADRSYLLAAAATVFRRNSIPVRMIDERRGLVQGEAIRVQYDWGGEPVSARLSCSRSLTGENRLETGLWEVTVHAETMHSSSYRSAPVVTGTARLRESVGASSAEEGSACGLRAEFVNRLETEIQSVADELIRADN